jgi:hypothetical protein
MDCVVGARFVDGLGLITVLVWLDLAMFSSPPNSSESEWHGMVERC